MSAAILMREGKYAACHWRQYSVITDGRVAIVHMVPALWGGWKFDRVEIQTSADWSGMSRDQIVAWKKWGHDDGCNVPVVNLDPDFTAKLLAQAGI